MTKETQQADGLTSHLTQELGMGTYKGFELLEEMPSGWVLDKTAGSPLFGYIFATNGKSMLNGGKRALLRVVKPQMQICYEEQKQTIIEQTAKQPEQVIDCGYVKTVNELARAKFKKQILNEILVDLMICEIEGWCKKDYINELKELICSLGKQQCIDA